MNVDSYVSIGSIGFYGPVILAVITCLSLLKQLPYLLLFLIGLFINSQFNSVLKSLIKEPRPSNVSKYEGAQQYGMPSGHAQSVFFSLTFLYLVKTSYWLLLTMLFFAALTLYQRSSSNEHNSKQLLVGSFVGLVSGYAWFKLSKYIISPRQFAPYNNTGGKDAALSKL